MVSVVPFVKFLSCFPLIFKQIKPGQMSKKAKSQKNGVRSSCVSILFWNFVNSNAVIDRRKSMILNFNHLHNFSFMIKKLLFKSLTLLLLSALGAPAVSAQTFWTETFGTAAAFSAWKTANVSVGTEAWKRSTAPAANMGFNTAPKAFASPTAANGFAFFNSDANGAFDHDATLTSPVINCASQTSVRIRFHSQFAQDATSEASVRVSSDNGATWTSYPVLADQPSYGLGQSAFVPTDIISEVSLPAANGKAAVLIQFRWVGNFEYGWKLDDVELYNYVAPKADVTFKVNMSLQTVSGEGARIAGSFNGWTDEVMTNEGNGIWSITKSLSEGETIQYKFKNGSGGWEAGQAACGVNDGNGGFNRQFAVKGAVTIPLVCFNACKNCVIPCSDNLPANKLICDNFDSYVTTMKLAKQSPTNWTTWSGTTGTNEDGIVSTEQAASAPNSLKIISTLTGGGPQDVVLKLANKNAGRYSLKWKMFIPVGKGGYYNIQNTVPIPATPVWNLDVHFADATNTGRGAVTQVDKFTFGFPHGQWFTVEHVVDLDNNVLTYYVNDKIAGKIAFTGRLGGIDFYGENATNTYYVDDVEYVVLPASPAANANVCETAVDLSLYFGQAAGVTQSTPSYDNTNATASPYDPQVDCWSETNGVDFLDNTLWFSFVGDGKRYIIETDSCSTKFLTDGDTQMAIFEGPDCYNLTEVACSDDIDSQAGNYRSGIDIETEAGKVYFVLVDGYRYPTGPTKGEFCFKITQKASVTCAQGAVGSFEVANNGFVCDGTTVSDLITTDDATFVIPNEGPVFGMTWAITTDPVPAGVLPSEMAGMYWGSFSVLGNVYSPALVNDNDPLAYGVWYFTPVVVAGAVDSVASTPGSFLHELDFSDGCYFVGQSVPFLMLPPLDDISATSAVTKETVPPGNNGKIDITADGGFPGLVADPTFYVFQWSNGATTEDISSLAAGTYTVSISDPSGCVSPFSVTIVVEKTVGTEDPASVKSLTVVPNPTSGTLLLNLSLENAADVRIEVVNALGQVLQTLNIGKVNTLNQPLDLSTLATGTYTLRVTVDGETAQRRVVVQK